MYWLILFTGFGGGLIRGLVGFIKYQYSYKDVKFQFGYFLFMIFLSGVVGVVSAALLYNIMYLNSASGPIFGFIAGYAGGDFIENIFKITMKKPSLYNLPDMK
ncbi:hypothetical protein ACFL14_01560 [Patescibacteria group bacterium]